MTIKKQNNYILTQEVYDDIYKSSLLVGASYLLFQILLELERLDSGSNVVFLHKYKRYLDKSLTLFNSFHLTYSFTEPDYKDQSIKLTDIELNDYIVKIDEIET